MALINVTQQNTFEEWRVKSNSLSSLVGDGATLATTSTNLVDAINEVRSGSITGDINTNGNSFRVQIDSPDTFELTVDASGNLAVTGTVTGTRFFGPVTGNVTGNLTGNADTATKLATARNIAITGDATYTTSFDGSANVTGSLTLSTSGVTAGTYTKITVDAKGRATAGTALSGSDVTTALGYTPWHPGNDGTGSGLDADFLDGYNTASVAAANTIALRDASGNLSANVFNGTATTARYADLAEKYTTDKEYPIGTVIVVASGGDAECTQSFIGGQLAIGVVSEKPAFLMNKDAEGQAIALKGRVPVRVVGPIAKGQSIMASADGRAIYGQLNPVGVALETNLEFSEKLVECVIL